MALLEVFVTPLRRYLSGDLAVATQPVAVAGGGRHHEPVALSRRSIPPQHLGDFIAALRRRLPGTLDTDLPWREEGEPVFASQLAADAWHALRAFAVDEYYPVPGFTFGAESHRHPGLERVLAGGRSGFRHLIRQHQKQGFYLPTDFPAPFELSDWQGQDAPPLVGSSLSLLRELNHLRRALGLSQDLGQPGWEEQVDPDDPLERVKTGWVFMRYCARLSVRQKLPIVLEG
jgi:hypothetical protein